MAPSPFVISDSPSRNQRNHIADLVPSVARALMGLVEDRGLSPDRLCRGLGFAYQDLMLHNTLLSHRQTRLFILRVQRLLGEATVGLAAGARQTPVSWGLPGLAMLTCETFGEAIQYGIAHQGAAGAMVEHRMQAQGAEITLEVVPRRFDQRIEAYLVEEAFASAIAISRYLVGTSFKPLRVDVGYRSEGRLQAYRQFFRCPVRFEAGAHRITIDAQWVGARLPGYDHITCSQVREQLEPLLAVRAGRHDLAESLANRMRSGAESPILQKQMARQVNLSDRTLRRRLSEQGSSYRELRDDTLFERARDLLANSDLTMLQIAQALGYSDGRAFRRAFQRWSGLLPTEFRSINSKR